MFKSLIRGHCLSFAVVGGDLSSGVRPRTVDSTPPLCCGTECSGPEPKRQQTLVTLYALDLNYSTSLVRLAGIIVTTLWSGIVGDSGSRWWESWDFSSDLLPSKAEVLCTTFLARSDPSPFCYSLCKWKGSPGCKSLRAIMKASVTEDSAMQTLIY